MDTNKSRNTSTQPDIDTTNPPKETFLAELGERVRALRARRGMTRRVLAQTAKVSERHLANLESGTGNASVQFLRQVAHALNSPLAELIGDETSMSPEWLMIREALRGRSDVELADARTALLRLFGTPASENARRQRIALIGLRGAGKSTLGRALADRLGWPFVEINREVERLAGCGLPEIHSLYGPSAYRRYERRALEEAIARYPRAVFATPGGIVADPGTFNLLLGHCFAIWLKASPAEHMARVVAQGDLRPMAGNDEAMADLQRILASRTPFYAKADLVLDTGDQTLAGATAALTSLVDDVVDGGER